MPMRRSWPEWPPDGPAGPGSAAVRLARFLYRHRVSVVGVTRFSSLFRDTHPFSNAHLSFEERESSLFDEARLRRRFALWEALTLPSLGAQTDGDFSLLVVGSALMPDWAKQRLRDNLAAAPMRTRLLLPEPEDGFARLVRQGVRALANPDHGRIATFRLDDDDALASDWHERLRQVIRAEAGRVSPAEIFGFEEGWFMAAEGEGVRLCRARRPLIACGLARVSPRSPLRTIHSGRTAHDKLDQVAPTVSLGQPAAWIVAAHDLNDSGRMGSGDLGRAPVLSVAEARARLGPAFAAIDLDGAARAL